MAFVSDYDSKKNRDMDILYLIGYVMIMRLNNYSSSCLQHSRLEIICFCSKKYEENKRLARQYIFMSTQCGIVHNINGKEREHRLSCISLYFIPFLLIFFVCMYLSEQSQVFCNDSYRFRR
jgi:hypothetical protein